jgi:hypothetical protein
MRYTVSACLIALASAGAISYSKSSLPQVHEIVQLPNVWFENAALRSNGDLLLTTIGEGKVYTLNTATKPPKPHAVVTVDGVNALSGIVEVAQDVFAVTGHVFEGNFLNNTMNLSLLKFSGSGVSVRTVFEKSKYGPVNGIVALPCHRHVILAADSARGEVLRIDTTTGHIEVAIKDDQLAPIAGGLFPIGVNGLKIFKNYLYFTNTARQALGRVKIDNMGNRIDDIQIIAKLEKGSQYAPDDLAIDKHGNAYVVYWQDRLVKITPQGKQTVLVEGLLAGPTSAVFSKDHKTLYVVTAGQNDDKVSGGQVVEIGL